MRRSVAYNAIGRLIEEQRNAPAPGGGDDYIDAYVYDLTGNRLRHRRSAAAGVTDTRYTYNVMDQLLTETVNGVTTTYAYDAFGRTTSRDTPGQSTWTYTYSADDRLRTAAAAGSTVGYAYDPDGIRIGRSIDSAPDRRYLVDPLNATGYAQVMEETDDSGVLQRAWTVGYSVLSQVTGGGTRHDLLPDAHGSTRTLATAAQGVAEVYDYDAYGNTLDTGTLAGAALTPLLYSGEWFASGVGKYYQRERWYNSAVGRFDRADPFAGVLASPLSLHKYAYAHGDPVNGRDPSGMFSTSDIGASISIAAILMVLIHPNVANAPARHEETYSDTSGDMMAGVAISFVVAPPLVVAGKIAGPLANRLFMWRGQRTVVIPTATGEAGVPGRVVGRATFVNPGPLDDAAAATFSGGRYTIVQTTDDVILFRGWGGKADEFGGFWSTQAPRGSLQTQIDSALLPEWGNTATNWTAIRVPAGTRIYIGEVSSQGGAWVGGGSQVLIEGGPQQAWKVAEGLLH